MDFMVNFQGMENPQTPESPQEETPEGVKYWAAHPPFSEEMASEITVRVREYYEAIRVSGILDMYRQAHRTFYSLGPGGHEGASVFEFGEDGEKLGVKSNQFRSLVRYLLISATADRPVIQPRAVNNTSQAMAQVPIAKRVLEYYHHSKRLERMLVGTALRAILYGKGYLWQSWDPTIGPLDPVAGKPAGDLVYQACSPIEVASDLERKAGEHDWFVITRPRNRYDLIAIFAPPGTDPELAEKIAATGRDCLEESVLRAIPFTFWRQSEHSDLVYERHFIHRRTPAMPKGRYVIMVGADTILYDGDLQYEDMPVAEMIPEEFLEAGSIGYSSAWDLIGLQQAYDSILSTCLTNFDAFGTNDLLLPDGVELSNEVIRDGLNAIRYPRGEENKPAILEKFTIQEEVFKLRDVFKSDMETNLGVNSVARGEPQSSLQTGPALALVQAQAVHFQSGLIASFTQLIEDTGTTSIRILKAFAQTPRIAAIAGSTDPDGLLAFSAKDVDQIDRVEVERGNPVFRTLAGKYDLADKLLERGLITNPDQYYQVLETGRLEPVTDGPTKEAAQIQAENEALMKGPTPKPKIDQATGMAALGPDGAPVLQLEEVPVVMTDHPLEHLNGHKDVLNSPENRKDPAVVQAVTLHMLEHVRVWLSTSPEILMLLGYPIPGIPSDPQLAKGVAAKAQAEAPQGGPANDKAPEKGSDLPSLPKQPKAPESDKTGRPTGVK